MKWLLILTSLVSLICGQNIALPPTASKTNVQKSEQDQGPLTRVQVEKLLENPVREGWDSIAKDQAIATEIRRRGIDFQPTDEIFENFRKLGAGPNVIQALIELRVSRSSSNAELGIRNLNEKLRVLTEELRKFREEKNIADIPSPRREDNKPIELPPNILEKLERLDLYERAGIPLAPEAYFEEGRLFFASGNYIKAVEKLRIAVNLNPAFAKAHYLLSVSYNHVREYKNQLLHAQRALDLAGTDLKLRGSSLNSIGIAQNRLGNPADALTAFLQARDIYRGKDPIGEARVSSNLGLLHLAQKDFKNAKENFDNALRLYRNLDIRGHARALHNLGVYYLSLRASDNKSDEAFNHFQAVLDLLKDTNHNDLKVGSWMNQCVVFYNKKMMDKSEKCYGELTNALPVSDEDLAKINHNLGNIRQYNKDFEGSIPFYLKSLELKKSIGYLEFSSSNLLDSSSEGTVFQRAKLNILKSLVYSYLQLNRLSEAVPYIRQILELDDKDPDGYYNMACYYSLQKNRDEAILYLKKGKPFFPSSLIDWSKKDPDLEFIRDDSEFQKIMYGEQGKP